MDDIEIRTQWLRSNRSIVLHRAIAGAGERTIVLLHGFPLCFGSTEHALMKKGERP